MKEELIPQLQDCRLQVDVIKQDSKDLVAGLTNDQFNWRVGPGYWSIAECLDHLTVTGNRFLPNIDKMIAEARKRQLFSKGPFRYGFLGNIFVRFSEPPPRVKVKAPKIFVPSPDQPMEKVVLEFMAIQEQILERIEGANGLNLAAVKRPSPATKLLKLSLGQWILTILAHERRHLWQARQVKNDQNFPGRK